MLIGVCFKDQKDINSSSTPEKEVGIIKEHET